MLQVLQAETKTPNIKFLDLAAQQEKIRLAIDTAIEKVLDHGGYIMGPEVYELEQQLANFCGVKHAISCASGTDALMLALLAKNIQPNDAVLVPSFTFAATAGAVALLGAIPVFVDVLPDTFNLDVNNLDLALHTCKKLNLKVKGIISVDLFGQPIDYHTIMNFAAANNLWLISDAAQSFGATYHGKKVGNICELTTTSFYPSKPLGCYGDGGAIFTNDDELAAIIKSIRVHGEGLDKYQNIRIGFTGRMDTIQAAILLEKLKIFPQEIFARNQIATRYSKAILNHCQTPFVIPNSISSWAQYTVVLPNNIDRTNFISTLEQNKIPTRVFYSIPLHLQPAYQHYPRASTNLKTSEYLSKQVLSLPMCPYLNESDREHIINNLLSI